MRMTAELRTQLKAAQDARARRTLRNEPHYGQARMNGRGSGCSNCGCPMDDWTLGCFTCRERHRAYHKRMHYPNGEAWYLERKEAHRLFHVHGRQDARARNT